jgi:DNA polymerase III subunit epsilon
MKDKLYAIIDIETTGGSPTRDRITEIAIVLHDGRRVVDKYQTLVNPECYIPYGITQLTGITQEMVQDAPRFFEVAREVVKMTEGAVFVAHNVRFDYGFIREEFRRLGYAYSRKQLCTVRLSRKAFPGLGSYSLDNLIQRMNLRIENRHRAMGDAMATTQLFEMILGQKAGEENLQTMVNLGIRESKLPKNLSIESIHALPEDCGVYYFHDEKGNVVYVGKSINIRKRVAEHFADITEKAKKLQEQVHEITFEITGSELIALLLESFEIKRLRPPVNRAQKVQSFPYLIHTFANDDGYICFEVAKVTAKERKKMQILSEFPKLTHAKGQLQAALKAFELCGRFCYLQPGKGACFNYHLRQCRGACAGLETPDEYNSRARQAVEALSTVFDKDFFILDKGRCEEEHSVALIENGSLRGFGYIDRQDLSGNLEELRNSVRPYIGNPETTRIIQRFLSQNSGAKVVEI